MTFKTKTKTKTILLLLFVVSVKGYDLEICSSNGVCSCDYGWGGEICNNQCPGGSDQPCNNNGLCLYNLTCHCDLGYIGDSCEHECDYTIDDEDDDNANKNVCNNRGVCFYSNITNSTLCECEDGWMGDGCENECAGGFDDPCSNNGVCTVNGTCVCDEEWVGRACNIGKDSIFNILNSNNSLNKWKLSLILIVVLSCLVVLSLVKKRCFSAATITTTSYQTDLA